VALLSGSFDPLTLGHVALSEAALDHANLVLLVYSVRTLPKEGSAPGPLLSEEERLAVLEAFCERRPRMEPALSSHGLLAEQVQAASARFPSSDLALVMGSDKVRQLLDPSWYEDREATLRPLFSRARILYAVRAGEKGVVEELLRAESQNWRHRFQRLEVPSDMAALSSRRVRELVAAGQDVSGLLPPEALALVRRSGRG
jgi:cytidyltransferase-like protein